MWFLQIIESVLNLEVMKLDFSSPATHTHTHTHTYTHCPVSVPFFPPLSFFSSLSLSYISLSFSLLSLSRFSVLPLFSPKKSFPFCHLRPTHTHTHTYTHRSEEGEINSDLNVLSWCVSVVKASVNRVQQRMMRYTAAIFTAHTCKKCIFPTCHIKCLLVYGAKSFF